MYLEGTWSEKQYNNDHRTPLERSEIRYERISCSEHVGVQLTALRTVQEKRRSGCKLDIITRGHMEETQDVPFIDKSYCGHYARIGLLYHWCLVRTADKTIKNATSDFLLAWLDHGCDRNEDDEPDQ